MKPIYHPRPAHAAPRRARPTPPPIPVRSGGTHALVVLALLGGSLAVLVLFGALFAGVI